MDATLIVVLILALLAIALTGVMMLYSRGSVK